MSTRHDFWGAGEADCPDDIKAGNGELHTLRCKACGQDNPRDDVCSAKGVVIAFEQGGDVGESTSAQVASTAARLLGMANPLMRGSPYHGAVLEAVRNSALKADSKTLDLIEELAKVLEPFMRDVRTVAGSALTQFVPVVDEGHD